MKILGKEITRGNTNPTKEMSFFDHLEELRWTILRSLFYIIILSIVFFIFKDFSFNRIVFGPLEKDFPTYKILCSLGKSFCIEAPHLNMITRKMGEQFLVHCKVSVFLAIVFAFPLIIWELWRFIAPGLNLKEQKITGKLIFFASFLFYLGVAFGFYVISPFSIKFFADYTVGNFAQTMPTLDSYVEFLVMLTLPSGLIFELPLVVYFLSKAGIVNSTFLRKYRRHSIVIIMIVAAIITPPDAFTQTMVAIPLLIVYEISIFVAKSVEVKNKDEQVIV